VFHRPQSVPVGPFVINDHRFKFRAFFGQARGWGLPLFEFFKVPESLNGDQIGFAVPYVFGELKIIEVGKEVSKLRNQLVIFLSLCSVL